MAWDVLPGDLNSVVNDTKTTHEHFLDGRMELGGRPTFGGMEKAFSTEILAGLDEFFAGRMRIDSCGRKAGKTIEHGRKCRKTCRRLDDRVQGPWASLVDEILVSVMLKLSIIDYFAFSGVCRSWRSAAIGSQKYYMECQQQPLVVVRSRYAKRACFLYNMFDGKSYKAMLPDLCGKRFVGLSSGYLITIDKNKGFWLVNLMTRHELHFPKLPGLLSLLEARDLSPILFQSTRLSKVFMILFVRGQNLLLLSESGSSSWKEHFFPNISRGISDVKIFDGTIFILTSDALLGVFNPGTDSILKLYKINIHFELYSEFTLVTSDDKLYVFLYRPGLDMSYYEFPALYELDHKKMECVKQIDDLGAKSLFLSVFNSFVVDTTGWGAGNCICLIERTFLNECLNEWSIFHLNGNRLATAPLLWDAPTQWEPYYWYFPKESCGIICVGDEFGV